MTPTKVQRQEQPVSNVVSGVVVDVEEGVGAAMRVVPQRKMDMMLTGTVCLGLGKPLVDLVETVSAASGRYSSYLLPRQDGGTSQIQVIGRFKPS